MNGKEYIDIRNADIRPGDRIGVYLDVVQAPGQAKGAVRVNVAGHDYDLSRFQIFDHMRVVAVGDRVLHDTFTDEVATVVAFLQKDGTPCPPNVWSQTVLCSTQHGPRILKTDEVRRIDEPKRR